MCLHPHIPGNKTKPNFQDKVTISFSPEYDLGFPIPCWRNHLLKDCGGLDEVHFRTPPSNSQNFSPAVSSVSEKSALYSLNMAKNQNWASW